MRSRESSQGNQFSEERSLAPYLRDISSNPLITEEEKGRLAKRARKGDRAARDKLIGAHLRFVVHVAKKYRSRGVPLSDLISEGNLGLMKAVERFDETRNTRFTTYAIWWIRQRIQQAIADNSHPIRLPANKRVALSKIIRYQREHRTKFQMDPSISDLASLVKLKEYEVYNLLRLAGHAASLDRPVHDECETRLVDLLPEENEDSPEQAFELLRRNDEVRRVIATMDKRDEKILLLHFGLTGGRAHTLEEIGERLSLSRERVRQLKNRALAKLRGGRRAKRLQECVS